ncbi:MAG: peptidyl-prolyl cis-trans isomerase [Alphaproteobacteria bacterium]|nr:peptidyl-prolyl cis-trans isomerase [Alphaproteobacteria bacterium]
MVRPFIAALAAGLLFAPVSDGASAAGNPRVKLTTNYGAIVVELYADKAPKTVDNFLAYVASGHYAGTVFHRVIQGFMIQGGGFAAGLEQKPTNAPVKNEADNGLKNEIGTLAMARTSDPHSASAQFFINTASNAFLNHRGKSPDGWGYAVFGMVVEGMDVVRKIEAAETHRVGRYDDVPVEDVVIEKAEALK